MTNLDDKVTTLLDEASAEDQEDEDALIEALEEDDELDTLREKRREQLHAEITRARQMKTLDHDVYDEISDEKALMDITTSNKLCVVHFFKHDFNRCRIMNTHLETLSKVHLNTRFLRISVENCPFLVVKLKIQVLPCVIAFVEGVGVDRIIGFEGLGRGTDVFSTGDLERRLVDTGVLVRSSAIALAKAGSKENPESDNTKSSEESEDDWD